MADVDPWETSAPAAKDPWETAAPESADSLIDRTHFSNPMVNLLKYGSKAVKYVAEHPKESVRTFNKDVLPMVGGEGLREATIAAGVGTAPVTGGTSAALAAAAQPAAFAIGYAGGKKVGDYLNQKILGDEAETTLPGALTEAAALETGGKAIDEIGPAVKKAFAKLHQLGKDTLVTPFSPKLHSLEIYKLADSLGIPAEDVPGSVLSQNPAFQKQDQALSQSGNKFARESVDQYNRFFKGIKENEEKVRSLADPNPKSADFAIGKEGKTQLQEEATAYHEPTKEMYEDLGPHFQRIPVHKPSVNQVFGNLKKMDIFQTTDGKLALADMQARVLGKPELNSLKELRSNIYDDLSKTASKTEEKRADAFYHAVTNVRDASIQATKAELPAALHPEVDALHNQIALADSAHSGLIDQMNEVLGTVGGKPIKSPSQFFDRIADLDNASFTGNLKGLTVEEMQGLQNKFPKTMELAKRAKINELVGSAGKGKQFFSNFANRYDALSPEMQEMIFSPEQRSHIERLSSLKSEIPKDFGPSGTPEGIGWLESLKNVNSIKASKDQLLRGIEAAKGGPDKWANDGVNKLLEHGAKINDVDLLLNDPHAKDMLVRASAEKPGSKAMEDIAHQVELKSLAAHPDDAAALKWAMENRTTTKAKRILKMNGKK